MQIDVIPRPGAVPAAVIWEWLETGPDGRPLLLCFGGDPAGDAEHGGDPADVHLRWHVDRDTPVGRYAIESGNPPDVATIPGATFRMLDWLATHSRDELAEMVTDRAAAPWRRLLAYMVYQDRCSTREHQAFQAWNRRINLREILDPADVRELARRMN